MRFIGKDNGKHVAELDGNTVHLSAEELAKYGYEEDGNGRPVPIPKKPLSKEVKGPKEGA